MLELALPSIKPVVTERDFASYEIEPLQAGYGRTLGNALRRVLLSSLAGSAITSIRIEGAKHEFQDLAGIKEDVTDIVLNVKKIRLRSFADHPTTMHIEVSGQHVVTAADIQAPSTIEIVTPDVYLCTLDGPDAHLDMELVVERGTGYAPAEANENQPIGVIPVDAIYSPVQRVNYLVENTRVGQMTNFDRITLQIWTDGTITPEEALRQAAHILVDHFRMIANVSIEQGEAPAPSVVGGTVAAPQPATALEIPQNIWDMPIEDLPLSVRAFNCLKRSGITKVGQVLTMNEEDLLAVRNFGEKSLDELRDALQAQHLLPTSEQIERLSGAEQ